MTWIHQELCSCFIIFCWANWPILRWLGKCVHNNTISCKNCKWCRGKKDGFLLGTGTTIWSLQTMADSKFCMSIINSESIIRCMISDFGIFRRKVIFVIIQTIGSILCDYTVFVCKLNENHCMRNLWHKQMRWNRKNTH